MKLILLAAAILIFASCNNDSSRAKIYEDSANYYADKMTEINTAGYSTDDSIYQKQKSQYFIYQTMRQHYLDKMKEAQKWKIRILIKWS